MANPSSTSACPTTIDWAIAQLQSQWPVKAHDRQAKGEALLRLLQQIGEQRFHQAITRTIDHHRSDFCPTIAQIRANVPANPEPAWDRKYPEEDRFNVFALVRQIAEKHDMNRGRDSKAQVREAWAKYQASQGMSKWTWPDADQK
jgi:hypothetical protein